MVIICHYHCHRSKFWSASWHESYIKAIHSPCGCFTSLISWLQFASFMAELFMTCHALLGAMVPFVMVLGTETNPNHLLEWAVNYIVLGIAVSMSKYGLPIQQQMRHHRGMRMLMVNGVNPWGLAWSTRWCTWCGALAIALLAGCEPYNGVISPAMSECWSFGGSEVAKKKAGDRS